MWRKKYQQQNTNLIFYTVSLVPLTDFMSFLFQPPAFCTQVGLLLSAEICVPSQSLWIWKRAPEKFCSMLRRYFLTTRFSAFEYKGRIPCKQTNQKRWNYGSFKGFCRDWHPSFSLLVWVAKGVERVPRPKDRGYSPDSSFNASSTFTFKPIN